MRIYFRVFGMTKEKYFFALFAEIIFFLLKYSGESRNGLPIWAKLLLCGSVCMENQSEIDGFGEDFEVPSATGRSVSVPPGSGRPAGSFVARTNRLPRRCATFGFENRDFLARPVLCRFKSLLV